MSNIENQNQNSENNEKLEVTNQNSLIQETSNSPEQSAQVEVNVQNEQIELKGGDDTAPKVEKIDLPSEEEQARIAAEARKRAEEKQKQLDADFAKIKEAFEKGEPIEVTVNSRIKGGLRVMFNEIPMFLPTSHFGLRRNPSEDELTATIGQKIKVHIQEISEDEDKRKTIIVSRKKIILDSIWDKIKVGDIVEGTVSSVASFGIFLDLGGVEGLIHISRLSQQHVESTKDIAKRGDKMQAVVVEVDRENNRIALSRKELEKSPWQGIEQRYPVGSVVKGIVRRFTDFGAYVEVEKGIDGLIRLNELSWTRRIKSPADILKISEEVEFKVINVSEEKKTLHLSLKQMTENPWNEIKEKYVPEKLYNGIVKQVMPQGCVVTVEDEVDGFMPRSKMKNLARGKKIPFNVGQAIEVVISDISVENESMILEPNPEYMNTAIALEHKEKEKHSKKQSKSEDTVSSTGGFSIADLLPESITESLLDNSKK
jgi:small subunit ribosomal protein S1